MFIENILDGILFKIFGKRKNERKKRII